MNLHGGKRELGESILETAKRELFEETGAIKYDLVEICPYLLTEKNQNEIINQKYGMLYYAKIIEFAQIPEMEIEKIYITNDVPMELTYEEIQNDLMNKVMGVVENDE